MPTVVVQKCFCPRFARSTVHRSCALRLYAAVTCGIYSWCSESISQNILRVVCGNCSTPFVFKEYEETCLARSAWEADVAALEAAVKVAEEERDEEVGDKEGTRVEVSEKIIEDLLE